MWSAMGELHVRAASSDDDGFVVDLARRRLGSEYQVHSRRQFYVVDGNVLVAEVDGVRAGFVTWESAGATAEVLAIAADTPRRGVGAAMMRAAEQGATDHGCALMCVVTTDANEVAQRFYAALGYELAERLVGAVDECRRRFKPEIPAHMHDELRYERVLPAA
jgi:ribosomal protein S18 acetylase RimI-like enzyme